MVRNTDKGTVLQFPWSIGRTYREFGTTEVRDHFLAAIQDLTGQQVFADLPEQVEMIVSRDEQGFVIHLINQSGARRKSFGPHIPITGGRIRIAGAGRAQPELLVSKDKGRTGQQSGDLTVDLPALELFEVVRVAAP